MTTKKQELLASVTAIAIPVVAVIATAAALKFITNLAVAGIVIAGIITVAAPIITAAGYKLFENFSEEKETNKEDVIEIIKENKKQFIARVSTVAAPVVGAIAAGLIINYIADTAIKVAAICGIAAVVATVLAPSIYETLQNNI